MATTYTPLLGLALPTAGELFNTWGTVVNDSITELIEDSVAGVATASVTGGNWTLSTTGSGAANEARCAILIATGSPGTSRNVIAPSKSKAYIVINQSDSSIVLKGAVTTGVTLASGTSATVAWNGSDFVKVSFTDLAQATVTGFNSTGYANGVVIYFRGRDTANDGGGGWFTYDASGTQTVDGGLVFAPTGGGRLLRSGWTSDGFNGPILAEYFGAITSASLQAAIDAIATTGGEIVIPAGTYTMTATLEIENNGTYIRGSGWGTTLTRSTDYGDTFYLHGNDGTGVVLQRVGISNLRIRNTGNITSGAHIHCNGVTMLALDNIYTQDGFKAYQFDGLTAATVTRLYTVMTDNFGGTQTGRKYMQIGVATGSYTHPTCGDLFIDDFNLRGNTSGAEDIVDYGVDILGADGVWMSNGHIGNANLANMRFASGSDLMNLVFVDNVMLDEGITYGLYFEGNTVVGNSIEFTGLICKGGVACSGGIATSSNASYWGVKFNGGSVKQYQNTGISIQSTNFRDIHFMGVDVGGNGKEVGVDNPGYSLGASTRDIYIDGGKSGSGDSGPAASNTQSYGLVGATGHSNVMVTNVDFRNNDLGSLLINPASGIIVKDCQTQESTTVASAAVLLIPDASFSEVFDISGTTTINSVRAAWRGRTVMLIFAGVLTVSHAVGNIRLQSGVNLVTAAGTTLELTYDGTYWRN